MGIRNYIAEQWAKSSSTELEIIASRAMDMLVKRNKLSLGYASVVYTVSTTFLKELAHYLDKNPDSVIDLSGLHTYSIVNRPDDEGEKAGNIVPCVVIGKRFKDIFENGKDETYDRPEEFLPPEYPESCAEELHKICEITRVKLDTDNNLSLQTHDIVYLAITAFLEEIALYLKENPDVVIDVSSFHKYSVSKGEPQIEIGERFKVGCKNDDSTEEDEES